MLYLANGDLRDFEKSREIKISLGESSHTNLARSREKNRIGSMPYYQRWCITRHAQTAYAQATMDRVDLDTVSSDVHNSLKPSKLRGSETAVSKLLEAFRQFTNPFNITSSNRDALYCLSSGQPASHKVASDLLEYVDAGHITAEQFITSRLCNKTVKFHDTLKRQNLTTFKSMTVCKQLSTSQIKTVEIKADRNLLGRLLFLSRESEISLPKLFEYPLGPIPWALATADGGMIKTSKAQLLHYLESLVKPCHITPNSLKDVINILDGNALLQACSSSVLVVPKRSYPETSRHSCETLKTNGS